MASEELARLWRLAEIDRQIVELRHRAAGLDVGQRQQAEIDKLTPEFNELSSVFKGLQQKITDLELSQKGDDAKREKIQKEIYGGKVINPREVANLEKEIELIKKKQDADADTLLRLYDELPPAKTTYETSAKKVKLLQTARDERRKAAVTEKSNIETLYKQAAGKRTDATKGISPGLLARYENIRQHHGGIGMVEINKKTQTCGGCGTNLANRIVVLAKDDKIAICESCHRLLYYTEGVV